MNKEEQTKKLEEIQGKFDAVQKQLNDLNAEALRLQGEYRAINELTIEEEKK